MKKTGKTMTNAADSRPPFALVPWEDDFLRALLAYALEETGGDISRAEFIFPHARPKRYLSLLMHQEERIPRPVIMPGMHTVSALFSSVCGRVLARPAWNAGLLDRVGLLLSCVREEEIRPFSEDPRLFFPWGVKLAALFEECFTHLRSPRDFAYMEDQVSPYAAALLARLGRIFTRYENALKEREWTTPGHDAAIAASWLREHPFPEGVFAPDANTVIFIAGFHALSGAEDVLFRTLWENGARVVIHADAAILGENAPARPVKKNLPGSNGKGPHWSCKRFSNWAQEWNTNITLAKTGLHCAMPAASHPQEGAKAAPQTRYYAGFDLHSQLTELTRELADLTKPTAFVTETAPPPAETNAPPLPVDAAANAEAEEDFAMPLLEGPDVDFQADTAVILPDSGLLMPVLHHLPRVDVNISMGYPLARSPLFRLADTIARLQETRERGAYYWRDIIDLIRHPYLKMLSPEEKNAPGDNATLRRELHRLEDALRTHGRKFIPEHLLLYDETPQKAAREAPPAQHTAPGIMDERLALLAPEDRPSAAVRALFNTLLRTTLGGFANLTRPKDLADALERLCTFLLAHGAPLWRRFPIDAECLHRLRQSLIPELGRSALAEERFPEATLFGIFRSLLEAERVPFEAVPLVGLQVLGMLETRLLSFRRVIILDAVEENLPGAPAGDPLLPEALRPELGLPPLHTREQTAAYTFFRLIAGASERIVLWREGGDAPGIQDSRAQKSRFVEEMLWQEEKHLGRLLAANGKDGPLTVLESAIAPFATERKGVAVTPAIRELIEKRMARPVSASFLDTYLTCPARFFYERVLGLKETEEISEGDDPLAVGNLFHAVLQDCYTEHIGESLPGGEELAKRYGEHFRKRFFSSSHYRDLAAALPADSLAMLAAAAEKRLHDFLNNQPPTQVLALETPFNAVFSAEGRSWSLTGLADRIDLRQFHATDENDAAEDAAKASHSRALHPGRVILDYKTGRVPSVHPALWENDSLFARMSTWQASENPEAAHAESEAGEADPVFAELTAALESVQLPFYLFLHTLTAEPDSAASCAKPESAASCAKPDSPASCAKADSPASCLDASWVALATDGKEVPLFPSHFSAEKRHEIVKNRIPCLIYFLLRHIHETHTLCVRPGKHCHWCFCEKWCRVSTGLL